MNICYNRRTMKWSIFVFTLILVLAPAASFAMSPELQTIYDSRPDLQYSFDERGVAKPYTRAGFLIDMEDWARQYGWRAHTELSDYRPNVLPPTHNGVEAPEIDAAAWIVVDKNSGTILGAKRAEQSWPIASITKLMTANIVLDYNVNLNQWKDIRHDDEVGGARLYVENGTRFRLVDLMYATLVGSANNAANALSRTLGVPKDIFVQAMNKRAGELGFHHTYFADPTGIEVANTSNAREVAFMAQTIFETHDQIRKMTQTYRRYFKDEEGESRSVKTTNWMLYYPEYEDVWIMGGKTGFLYESEWNVVELIRPSQYDDERELVVVVLGSHSRPESFENVMTLSNWAWDNFAWIQ